MSTNLKRKLARGGVKIAEHNARRMFNRALADMAVMQATFIGTLNSLPFPVRFCMACRLVVGKMRPLMTEDEAAEAKARAAADDPLCQQRRMGEV